MIRYGILGCGHHALQSHAIVGSSLDLHAICDISLSQLDSFEQAYGSRLEKYTDREAFFDAIDAVLIATPDAFHYDDLSQAIAHDVHVLVEKPLAVSSKEIAGLSGLLDIASSKGLVVSSCHLRRYDPPFIWLKENMPSRVLEFGFDFSYHKPSMAWKHDRGLLLDHINHEIDLMHYLFGYCSFDAHRLHDGYDHYHAIGRRDDGLVFNFKGTRRLDSHDFLEWAYVRYDTGHIVLDAHNGTADVFDHSQGHKRYDVGTTDYKLRGYRVMENFYNAILGKEACYLTPTDLYVNNAAAVMLTEQEDYRWSI